MTSAWDAAASACQGKVRYERSTDAQRSARKQRARLSRRRRPGQRGTWLVPYHCPHCHGWHLGAKPNPRATQ